MEAREAAGGWRRRGGRGVQVGEVALKLLMRQGRGVEGKEVALKLLKRELPNPEFVKGEADPTKVRPVRSGILLFG